MPRLTAAMVLYNEELLIDLAIKSARDFVDEYVIVDNGCTDKTMEVASECVLKWGLKARFFDFEGQLRDARAFSFEKCETAWIFLHDGDHILQTEGEHSILPSRKLMNRKSLECYRYPLIRLYYDYFHTQRNFQHQPAHKLLFSNNPKCWDIAKGTRNIPFSTVPIKTVGLNAVWNCCIKRPERILERQYWKQWRGAGRPGTVREYAIQKRDIFPKQFVKYAEWWLYGRVFLRRGFIAPKVEEYGGYPAVIQEEIDAGVNRTSMDTVDSIREKRIDAGLSQV